MTIYVSNKMAEFIDKILKKEPACKSECFGEDDSITYTADLGDGYEMDISVRGVQYDPENISNLPWTEAVLFRNGSEVMCSEPDTEFFGDWTLGNYTVTVSKG